jgi:elongation factor Tu
VSPDLSFRMTIEDVFAIRGRGTVVTGRVESGTLHVGDTVKIETWDGVIKAVVTGIEMFRRRVKQANVGDIVGVVLRDVAKEDVQRGDVLTGNSADPA